MPLTPEAFARAWGEERLVRLPAAAGERIAATDRDFLVQAGLPALLICFDERDGGKSKITFCRLASGLSSVLGQPCTGLLPPELAPYLILGDEMFANGGAWWCLHQGTGHIERIDIEIEPPVHFVNSSVAHFASALLAAWSSSQSADLARQDWHYEVERLGRKLTTLDPASMSAPRAFWPSYLDFVLNDEPAGTLKRGSRAEGERALQEGSW